MPTKLSEVGRRHAQARASRGAGDLGMGATPAEEILGGEPAGRPTDPDTPKPVVLATSPEPLPEPASEIEEDQLRFILRTAIFELHADEGRLAALAQARDRAREEWRAITSAVSEAEETLRAARVHSRGDLVAAYVNNQPTGFVMTENHAQAELNECRDRLRHVEEIEAALRHEADDIEHGLQQRRHDIEAAAGRLLSRSPQFLNLIERIYSAYRTLRDTRLVIDELSHLVNIDDDLRRLAENNQPSTGHRFGGYLNDEVVITDWTNAITRLLSDADAPLPDPDGSSGNSDIGTNSTPDRGAPHRGSGPRRRRAQGAATPLSRRTAQRKRAGDKTAGMPVRRREPLARERDPTTGKWLPTKTAADKSPPPE